MERFEKLESKKVFDFFYEISQIPRESKNEQAISDYLKDFATKRGLWVKQDEFNNIIIKKPGTANLSEAPTVILQGHTDMVCEKDKDSKHDFSKDPIEWVIKDDFIYADKTTLGADDGIGVAYALAALDDDSLEHPPLEVIMTSDEETGMTGAINLDIQDLSGKIFINIDSEEEGLFYLSCAGGNDTKMSVPVLFEETEGILVELEATGLVGGHSGAEIITERANASKVMGRFLNLLVEKEVIFNLVSIDGGSKLNVITKDTVSQIVIDPQYYQDVALIAQDFNSKLKVEYYPQDPDVHISIVEKEKGTYQAMTLEDSLRVIYAIVLIPYGPLSYSKFLPDLVQTSTNLGVVQTANGEVHLNSTLRSSVITQKEALIEQFNVIGKLVGAKVVSDGFYPAWPYNDKSRIKDLFLRDYEELFDKEAQAVAIHAGLECGIFKEKMGDDVDFISFGPDINGAHTSEECVSISSIERSWQLMKKVLKSIKDY